MPALKVQGSVYARSPITRSRRLHAQAATPSRKIASAMTGHLRSGPFHSASWQATENAHECSAVASGVYRVSTARFLLSPVLVTSSLGT